MKSTILTILFFAIALMSCKPQNPGSAEVAEAVEETSVPSGFQAFYDQFHQDTAFQKLHITFPLAGLPANADTLSTPDFRWKSENWKWHRPIDPSLTGYEREWQVISSEMVIEKITEKTSGIGMERRFAKMDNDWMLIYYAGMNPTR